MANFEIEKCMARVVETGDVNYQQLDFTVPPRWEHTIEGKMAAASDWPKELQNDLRHMHEFSASHTKKQFRNETKKLCKKAAVKQGANSKKYRKVHGSHVVRFD